MKKIIIYCHGYGSSAQTDKVQHLRNTFPEHYVYAVDINVDPGVARKSLLTQIDWILVGHLNEPVEMVFVGTSLGAWYAHSLGVTYHARALLLNPCYNPAVSLLKYGVPEEVCAKYKDIDFSAGSNRVIIGDKDTVLNYLPIFEHVDQVYPGVDHRFGGDEFLNVVGRFVRAAQI